MQSLAQTASRMMSAQESTADVQNISMDQYIIDDDASAIIYSLAFFSLIWAGVNAYLVSRVQMTPDKLQIQILSSEEIEELKEQGFGTPPETKQEAFDLMMLIAGRIREGSIAFLQKEYLYLGVFVGLFAILVGTMAEIEDSGFAYTTIAFLVGAFTSMCAGAIGMVIAVYTNVRTTYSCCDSVHSGFKVAYFGGQVLGFSLVGLALIVLQSIIIIYREAYLPDNVNSEEEAQEFIRYLFEQVSGFGLGASTVALFGRVGGGIYTKAADVGADLAGKVCEGLPEDSPDNPGTIADNVGDNVGDIAGMGADLFGSLAESTCAALVVSASSMPLISTPDAIYFPLMVTSVGIFASFVTTFFVYIGEVNEGNIETKLKLQLVISTVIMTALITPLLSYLPETADMQFINREYAATEWELFGCIALGLWSGLGIGFITEYYTSNKFSPVIELAESCRMGAAPNIILGLALGYASTIIPIILLGSTIIASFTWSGMYGVSLAAIGMLGCLPVALAIDGYGPIADNAGGITEMSYLHEDVRRKTDKLDAAGNTTAAIGKGFAIGSACLVSLALFGAYMTAVDIELDQEEPFDVSIVDPASFTGLIIGAMVPYAFSALTMSAVGEAANEMIAEIQRQFNLMKTENAKPDSNECVKISTQASLKKMIAPGALVIFTPILTGIFFGVDFLAGYLAGNIVSGIQIAFSASNTGGAWDNAKKYVEEGIHESKVKLYGDEEGKPFVFKKKGEDGKSTPVHQAAVIGDTVGDPLKDTSGPSINILMKLSAITSLIFASFIVDNGGVIYDTEEVFDKN